MVKKKVKKQCIPSTSSIITGMKKYWSVVGSFLMMTALGGLYAWSIFVEPLKKEAGVTTGFTQLIFGIIIGILPVAMVFGGRIVVEYGPILAGVLSAILFGSGYIISGVLRASSLSLLIGIGLLSGIGTGFGYIAALSTPVKWFPGKRGLITGISTSGFGAGAIFLSLLVKMLASEGLSVHRIFLYIGIIYGILLLVSSFSLFEPDNFKRNRKNTEHKQKWHFDFMRRKEFWALFLGMFTGSFSGLVIIGNLKPIAKYLGVNEWAAVVAISVLSIGNTAGRIIWGHISDVIGMLKSIRLSLLLLGIIIVSLLLLPLNTVFVVLSLFIGLAFGANFVLYAASASIIFGTKRLSEVYPFISFAYGLGGLLGPPIGGFSYDITSSYSFAIFMSAITAIAGSVVVPALLSFKTLDSPESV